MNLGQRIKSRRKEIGLTQKELAEEAGVTQQLITKLESGKSQTSSSVISLAKALKVSPTWLDTGEGDRTSLNGGEADTPLFTPQQAILWREGTLPDQEIMKAKELGSELTASTGLRVSTEIGGRMYMLRYTGPELLQFGIPKSPITLIVDPDEENLYPSSLWLIDGSVRIGVYKKFDKKTLLLDFMDRDLGTHKIDMRKDQFLGWQVGMVFDKS